MPQFFFVCSCIGGRAFHFVYLLRAKTLHQVRELPIGGFAAVAFLISICLIGDFATEWLEKKEAIMGACKIVVLKVMNRVINLVQAIGAAVIGSNLRLSCCRF